MCLQSSVGQRRLTVLRTPADSTGASKLMWEGLAELVDSVASSGSGPARALAA